MIKTHFLLKNESITNINRLILQKPFVQIDRDDNVINLCEMKFYIAEFILNKKQANEIEKNRNVLYIVPKRKKVCL